MITKAIQTDLVLRLYSRETSSMSSTSHPKAANKGSMRAAFVFCSPMFSLRFWIFWILFLSLGNALVKVWCAELVISVFSPWIREGVLVPLPSLNDDILT